MPKADSKAEGKSKLPPTVLRKIDNLSGEHRRAYLSFLIAEYTAKTDNIEAVAKRSQLEWVDKQKDHLRRCIQELQAQLDAETKRA